MSKNKFYNITHVHRGLAFETALIDAAMMINENPGNSYLLGAVDEISSYNFNIDYLDGWYKKENVSNKDLYESQTPASIAGEGAAMFLVNDKAEGATAVVKAIKTLHTEDKSIVNSEFRSFIKSNFEQEQKPYLFLTGENGDTRLLKYYAACESAINSGSTVVRYKHMSGEYPTTSSFALWLACHLLQNSIPVHALKKQQSVSPVKEILIYNSYKGKQHSFIRLATA